MGRDLSYVRELATNYWDAQQELRLWACNAFRSPKETRSIPSGLMENVSKSRKELIAAK
jgi:hypothetical protein